MDNGACEYLTVKQVAAKLGLHYDTVRKYCADQVIPSVVIGCAIRIPRSWLFGLDPTRQTESKGKRTAKTP